VVSSERAVLHPFVKSKGLTLSDSSYSEPLDLGLAVISIALRDGIANGVKPSHQRSPHFDFPLLHVDSQLLEILLHHLPFSNFLNFVAILPTTPQTQIVVIL
jgi:hypothetical protein